MGVGVWVGMHTFVHPPVQPQRLALQWMMDRETSPSKVAVGGAWLPTEHGGVFLDSPTALVSDCRGGLLADEPVRVC